MAETELPDEYYFWEDFRSGKNFDVGLWSHFQVAIKFGRIRWNKYVRCKLCRRLVGWSRCTGNLKKHLKCHHEEELTRKRDEGIKSKIQELAKLSPENYSLLLQKLIKETFKTEPGKKRISITDDYRYCHEIPKKGGRFPIWNFYMSSESSNVNVRCCLCRRDVYWNQTGLEKLARHVESIHIRCSETLRVDELYRFAIRLGIQKFRETVT